MARYFSNGKEISKAEAEQILKDNEKWYELARQHQTDNEKWSEYMGKCKFVACMYDKTEPREITSSTYKRAQKRLKKQVDTFMGIR